MFQRLFPKFKFIGRNLGLGLSLRSEAKNNLISGNEIPLKYED